MLFTQVCRSAITRSIIDCCQMRPARDRKLNDYLYLAYLENIIYHITRAQRWTRPDNQHNSEINFNNGYPTCSFLSEKHIKFYVSLASNSPFPQFYADKRPYIPIFRINCSTDSLDDEQKEKGVIR